MYIPGVIGGAGDYRIYIMDVGDNVMNNQGEPLTLKVLDELMSDDIFLNGTMGYIKTLMKRDRMANGNVNITITWGWIDVNEKRPEYNETLLFLTEKGCYFDYYIDNDESIDYFLKGTENTGKITHWIKPVYPNWLTLPHRGQMNNEKAWDWISVEDELPIFNQDVLWLDKNKNIKELFFGSQSDMNNYIKRNNQLTHWIVPIYPLI